MNMKMRTRERERERERKENKENERELAVFGQGEPDECFVRAALSFLRTACHYFSPF